MTQRLTYLDIAAGIMTIWVMVFHALYPMFGTQELAVVPWLYFFMPWFFYKAGMMFKLRDCKEEWRKSARKLLIVFAIWAAIGYVAHIGWHLFVGDLTWRMAVYSPIRSLFLSASMPINSALWFLPVLFLVRGIGNWLLKYIRIEWIAIGSLALSIGLKFLAFRLMPAYISDTLWGLFFFAMGYWLRDKEKHTLILIIAAIVYVASLFTCIPSVYCGGQPMWAQLLWYPACVGGCVTFNYLCRFLEYVASKAIILAYPNRKLPPPIFPILTHVGRNAMNYYAPHKIIFHLTFNLIILYKEEWYSTWQGLVICLLAYAIILPMINLLINKIQCNTNSSLS